jgi:hypothetical protein
MKSRLAIIEVLDRESHDIAAGIETRRCLNVGVLGPADTRIYGGGKCDVRPDIHSVASRRSPLLDIGGRPAAVSRTSINRKRCIFRNNVTQPIHFANGHVRLPKGNLDASFSEGVKDCHR